MCAKKQETGKIATADWVMQSGLSSFIDAR